MLMFLGDSLSLRKMLLYGCACCRLFWDHLEDERSRQAVETAEQWADGTASVEDFEAAHTAAREAEEAIKTPSQARAAAYVVVQATSDAPAWHAPRAMVTDRMMDDDGDEEATEKVVTSLLRHLAGNPFRSYPAPTAWPSIVIDLARSLYNGDDNRRILADALEEAGHQDLADHFRQEEWHPKGCWVVDLILGKE